MPDFGELQEVASGFFSNIFAAGTTNYIRWFGYVFWLLVLVGLIFLIYFWMMYKYKITIIEGSVVDGVIKILKTKSDRARPMKERGVSKWKLLFSNKKIKPIGNEYILPNNRVLLFRTEADTFNPIYFDDKPSDEKAVLKMDPFDSSFYYLGIQQDALSYQKDDLARRQQIIMILTILICLVLVGLTVWLCLKAATDATAEIKTLANSLQGITSGVAPH